MTNKEKLMSLLESPQEKKINETVKLITEVAKYNDDEEKNELKVDLEGKRKINMMVNKRRAVIESNVHKSFQSQVKQIESLIDDGYTFVIVDQ